MATIYAKTEKGHAELESRAGGLKPKVRRVLILIDGHRDLDEVARLSLNDEATLNEVIDILRNEDYIALAGAPAPRTLIVQPSPEEQVAAAPPKAPPAPATPSAPVAPSSIPLAEPPPPTIAAPSKAGPNQAPMDPFGGIIKI